MTSWLDTAACLHHPRDLFFPDNYKNGAAPAKAVCRTCPVREDCLNDALALRTTDGIFGGLTPNERQQLRGISVWRDCTWCGTRFAHPDRLVITCGPECRDAHRRDQQRRSWQRRRSVA